MTLISEGIPATIRRRPALVHVVRNDGYCYGRVLFTDDNSEHDVSTSRDWYDADDEDAAAAFVRKAERRPLEEPAASWRVGDPT